MKITKNEALQKIKDWYKRRTVLGTPLFIMDCISGILPLLMMAFYGMWGYKVFLAFAFGWLIVTASEEIFRGGYFTGSCQGFHDGLVKGSELTRATITEGVNEAFRLSFGKGRKES